MGRAPRRRQSGGTARTKTEDGRRGNPTKVKNDRPKADFLENYNRFSPARGGNGTQSAPLPPRGARPDPPAFFKNFSLHAECFVSGGFAFRLTARLWPVFPLTDSFLIGSLSAGSLLAGSFLTGFLFVGSFFVGWNLRAAALAAAVPYYIIVL